MGWVHDVPEDDLYDHEGRIVAVLADGTEPGPTDAGTAWWVYDGTEGRPLAIGVKAGCACGWRSAATFPIDFGDHESTDGSGPFDIWQREHISAILSITMPTELSEALRTVERLVHQMATERPLVALTAIGHLETVIESEAPAAGAAARQQGATWDAIGKAIKATRQAAYQRFRRHLPATTN